MQEGGSWAAETQREIKHVLFYEVPHPNMRGGPLFY